MDWSTLFERAPRVTVRAVREALAERRARGGDRRDGDDRSGADSDGGTGTATGTAAPSDDVPHVARLVADADVLAADLLVGGPAREALDHWRRHSWVSLVVTERLLDDAAAVVAALADEGLAADWRGLLAERATVVAAAAAGHPALVAAVSGDAAHLLSYDERLRSAETGAALRPYVEVSVKPPDGFARLFDPESVYGATADGPYPGPDRDPRA